MSEDRIPARKFKRIAKKLRSANCELKLRRSRGEKLIVEDSNMEALDSTTPIISDMSQVTSGSVSSNTTQISVLKRSLALTKKTLNVLKSEEKCEDPEKAEFNDAFPKIYFSLHRIRGVRRSILSSMTVLEKPPSIAVRDVQAVSFYSVLGSKSFTKPRWIHVKPWSYIKQVLLVHVNISRDTFVRHATCFPKTNGNIVKQTHLDFGVFFSDFCTVPINDMILLKERLSAERELKLSETKSEIARHFYSGTMDARTCTIPSSPALTELVPLADSVNLLLTNEDMSFFLYPMPDGNVGDGFQYTKSRYKRVSSSSPLYAVDCEMCITDFDQTHELTRISVIDEHMNVIFDSLVKPDYKIVDYLTQYSGITKQMLDPVTTRLSDVQYALSKLLPDDAILVGHSLNHDLVAMEMYHPFVIDLSVAYNLSGDRNSKSSLQTLCDIFLGQSVQNSKKGHCSIEDALVTMKLLQLKIGKSLNFGNVSLGWSFYHYAKKAGIGNYDTTTLNYAVDEPAEKNSRLELASAVSLYSIDQRVASSGPIGSPSPESSLCARCSTQIVPVCRNRSCFCRPLTHVACTACLNESKTTGCAMVEQSRGLSSIATDALASSMSTTAGHEPHSAPNSEKATFISQQAVFKRQAAVHKMESIFEYFKRHSKKIGWFSRTPKKLSVAGSQSSSESGADSSFDDASSCESERVVNPSCILPERCAIAKRLANHEHFSTNKELVDHWKTQTYDFDLSILNMVVDDKNSCGELAEIDRLIFDSFQALNKNSLMCLVMSDERVKPRTPQHGNVGIRIKMH